VPLRCSETRLCTALSRRVARYPIGSADPAFDVQIVTRTRLRGPSRQ
jgi:hypothetical protein